MLVASLRASVFAGALLAVAAPGALAQPTARLSASSRCPDRGQMRAALRDVVVLEPSGADWTISIAAASGHSELVLRNRAGSVALTRRLASRDCQAVARAFAIILDGFFRQLAQLPRRDEPARAPQRADATTGEAPERGDEPSGQAPKRVNATAGDTPRRSNPTAGVAPRRADGSPGGDTGARVDRDRLGGGAGVPAAASAPRAQPRPSRPHGSVPRTTGSSRSSAATVRTDRSTARPEPSTDQAARSNAPARIFDRPSDRPVAQPVRPAVSDRSLPSPGSADRSAMVEIEEAPGDSARLDAPSQAARPAIELAIAAGAALSEPTGATGIVSVEGGWRFGQHLSARLQLSGDTPSVQESTGERIQLQRTGVAAGLGFAAERGAVWVRPALLAGASLWRISAQDLGEPVRLRVQPTIGASAAAGWRIGGSTSLRLELGATLFPSTDRYVVVPDGPAAQSPRILMAMCLGLEWASFL